MKRYDVYGVGNALVDMEFETTPDELSKLGVDKGVMTLVDEDRQAQLISSMNRDPAKRSCGGSAANTIIAVQNLGGSSYYSCKIAGDEVGQFFHQDLKRLGVHSNLDSVTADPGTTGRCLVMVTPDADRTMCTFLGVTADLSADQLDEAALRASSYVYVEGYLAPSDLARAAAIKSFEMARAAGIQTAISLSDPNMVALFGAGLKEMIGSGVDLLFCNEAEALGYAESESLDDAVAALKQTAKRFAITLGPRGALVFDGSDIAEIPAQNVSPVDTNGAGDLFAGAFLYGINHGMNERRAAELACRSSARLILEFGPRLEPEVNQEVLQAFLAQQDGVGS